MRKLFLLCAVALLAFSYDSVWANSADPAKEGVLVGDLYWAKGNLVADGDNGCKIGAPTDGGLYFQWGELVGWSGGATGDGVSVGEPTLSQRVTPSGYTGSTSWDDNYSNTGSYDTENATTGEGDPCRYYLGGKWRTPTSDEYGALFGGGGALPTANWSWSSSPASVRYTDDKLVFPVSGYRLFLSGSFGSVGSSGSYWISSVYNANLGYNLYFYSSYVHPEYDYVFRSHGFPVRCVSTK